MQTIAFPFRAMHFELSGHTLTHFHAHQHLRVRINTIQPHPLRMTSIPPHKTHAKAQRARRDSCHGSPLSPHNPLFLKWIFQKSILKNSASPLRLCGRINTVWSHMHPIKYYVRRLTLSHIRRTKNIIDYFFNNKVESFLTKRLYLNMTFSYEKNDIIWVT